MDINWEKIHNINDEIHTINNSMDDLENDDPESVKLRDRLKRLQGIQKRILLSEFAHKEHREKEQLIEQSSREKEFDLLEKDATSKECVICRDADKCIAFAPCGHIVTCPSCANQCINCPICRTTLTLRLKVYTS